MAKSPVSIAKHIAMALNMTYGTHIVINTTSFHGEGGKIIRMYTVKDAYNILGKYSNKELFCSASGVYICLFMADMLNVFEGREIEDRQNPGYTHVFIKKNGQAAIDYMKGAYLDGFSTE